MTCLVLCSGGIDSATLAALAVAEEGSVELCFVDYGQPARTAERLAVLALSDYLGVPVVEAAMSGLDVLGGEIPMRNALLVTCAAALRPGAALVALGVHAGTRYRDCSAEFVGLMQRLLDFHRDGAMRLLAPFVQWSKADIYGLALRLDVPLGLTHSCEAGDEPCGSCRSCADREALLAG